MSFPIPDYDSGWVSIGQGEQKLLTHKLGEMPTIMSLTWSQKPGREIMESINSIMAVTNGGAIIVTCILACSGSD